MLEGLYAGALADSEARRERVNFAAIEKIALDTPDPLDATISLSPSNEIRIIAEIKRACPSRGDLSRIAEPATLAEIYESSGAAAISVLTEERKFKGSLDDLREVRKSVSVPLLRKDFTSNEYQILEARAAGASIVLLIVAGLDMPTIARLKAFAEDLGLTAFIETHSADEVLKAIDLGAKLLGVNARDLSTFETDRNLFGTLAPLIPQGVIKVAESAVRDAEDVRHYRQFGADAVLVGEALVTNDPALMLKSFLDAGRI